MKADCRMCQTLSPGHNLGRGWSPTLLTVPTQENGRSNENRGPDVGPDETALRPLIYILPRMGGKLVHFKVTVVVMSQVMVVECLLRSWAYTANAGYTITTSDSSPAPGLPELPSLSSEPF